MFEKSTPKFGLRIGYEVIESSENGKKMQPGKQP